MIPVMMRVKRIIPIIPEDVNEKNAENGMIGMKYIINGHNKNDASQQNNFF